MRSFHLEGSRTKVVCPSGYSTSNMLLPLGFRALTIAWLSVGFSTSPCAAARHGPGCLVSHRATQSSRAPEQAGASAYPSLRASPCGSFLAQMF